MDILYNSTKVGVEYIFDGHITGFANGTQQTFDLLIAADGFRSYTRELNTALQPSPARVRRLPWLATIYLPVN